MGDNSLETLNIVLQKNGVIPTYEVILSNDKTDVKEFVTRLTCPITSKGGPSLVTEGSALSKKEAKRNAARAFIYKYLTIRMDDDSASMPLEFVTLTNNIPIADRSIILEIICSIIMLPKPSYVEVATIRTLRSPCSIVECRMSYLRSGGRGRTKAAAESEAATNMIQLLMEVESIYNMIKFRYLVVEMTNNAEAISNSTSIVVNKQFVRNNGIGGLYSGSKSLPDAQKKFLHGLMRSADEIDRSIESLDDARSDYMLLEDNFQGKQLLLIKTKSRSLNNLSECGRSNGNRIISDSMLGNTSHFKAIRKIDKALENAENQLYNEILNTLEQRDIKVRKKVLVLCKEFDLFINHDRRAKISDGTGECTDKSVRIACLTKLLLDLKKNIH